MYNNEESTFSKQNVNCRRLPRLALSDLNASPFLFALLYLAHHLTTASLYSYVIYTANR